jgi:hypothetical protein
MRRRPSSTAGLTDLPLPLRRVVQAASRECPRGHGDALRQLTTLALRKVPARGIFDPASRGEADLFTAIDDAANRHLGRRAARAGWRRALRASRLDLESRDRVERAALELQAASDTAYFYAGLAFGLTWVVVCRDG